MADVIEDTTAPLSNGDELPEHPANTTALKIVSYGKVWDAEDGRPLRAGIHRNELKMLMEGNKMALGHLYCYAILNQKIYHTRERVTIDVKCVE